MIRVSLSYFLSLKQKDRHQSLQKRKMFLYPSVLYPTSSQEYSKFHFKTIKDFLAIVDIYIFFYIKDKLSYFNKNIMTYGNMISV